MRQLAAAGLCAALQAGAFQAPLVHAHLDDHHDDHHDVPAVHAHVGGHAQHAAAIPVDGTTAVEAHADPEQATRVQIFVAVSVAAFVAPALPPARFTLAPPRESVVRQAPDEVRSHGPPPPRTTAPRAPPAFSVQI